MLTKTRALLKKLNVKINLKKSVYQILSNIKKQSFLDENFLLFLFLIFLGTFVNMKRKKKDICVSVFL